MGNVPAHIRAFKEVRDTVVPDHPVVKYADSSPHYRATAKTGERCSWGTGVELGITNDLQSQQACSSSRLENANCGKHESKFPKSRRRCLRH